MPIRYQLFTEIPLQRPVTRLLDSVNWPAQLRGLDVHQLPDLANELREYLLWCVGQSGGHFGAGLGVIELTIALHYAYNTPQDRLIWDVGHQAYPHKILTGRREQMLTMRKKDGLSPFPKRSESEYDCFGVGHSSTSISAALGMAIASAQEQKLAEQYARKQSPDRKIVAVIGDGAMTAGMAFEAIAHAAHTQSNLLVILNDNNMSISHNVGGLASYFAKIWASKPYTSLRSGGKKVLSHVRPALEIARKTEEYMKGMVSPAVLFEELGFNYIGPMDGHDVETLATTIKNLRALPGAQFLHVITQKGKGFAPAEADPVGYHALSKLDAKPKRTIAEAKVTEVNAAESKHKPMKFQDVFGQWLCDMAVIDERLIAITPAMKEGSGMVKFAEQFPDRFHDVAIAEQHAVTLAAGMACETVKPVVAIYSTFLQRAYDQLIHDVAIQDLDVLFAIDRAGLVGEDGATHAGSFDLSFLRCIPNLVIMAPSDENECRLMLSTGFKHRGPVAVRYPRGTGVGATLQAELNTIAIGKGMICRESTHQELRKDAPRIALLCFGTLLHVALDVADKIDATVVDMRFVKPLDESLIFDLVAKHDLLVTIEENSIAGGAGSAVNEFLNRECALIPVLNLGLPDTFQSHGTHAEMLAEAGLDSKGMLAPIQQRVEKLVPGKNGSTARAAIQK
jgi:1-deoxy-D-xylulose-5-phosphate synthase